MTSTSEAISITTQTPVSTPVASPVLVSVGRNPAHDGHQAIQALGDYLVTLRGVAHEVTPTMRELALRAGGDRMSPALFRTILLDLTDALSRVTPATWLGLCRGLALGVSLHGQGQSLPLPLHHAATALLKELPLRPGQRHAVAQALLL
jgi:hypothetical protein